MSYSVKEKVEVGFIDGSYVAMAMRLSSERRKRKNHIKALKQIKWHSFQNKIRSMKENIFYFFSLLIGKSK